MKITQNIASFVKRCVTIKTAVISVYHLNIRISRWAYNQSEKYAVLQNSVEMRTCKTRYVCPEKSLNQRCFKRCVLIRIVLALSKDV